ncbi:hypothetical protein [Nocardiopsis sp. CNT312]|uniref:hypothetical protein n=1 Tax=Nocardiopsis sp. CNT312 TaxID=1137268 RepID=UPI00048DAD9A|nr:hypothetical protein [Nocardiopsis sp. CNT312]
MQLKPFLLTVGAAATIIFGASPALADSTEALEMEHSGSEAPRNDEALELEYSGSEAPRNDEALELEYADSFPAQPVPADPNYTG